MGSPILIKFWATMIIVQCLIIATVALANCQQPPPTNQRQSRYLPPPTNQVKQDNEPKNSCCKTLEMRSSGSLSEGHQRHILGVYYNDESHDGEEGTLVYHQPGHGGGDPEVWLYYKGGNWPDMWFINQKFGEVQGFAWIEAHKQYCPESLEHEWKLFNASSG